MKHRLFAILFLAICLAGFATYAPKPSLSSAQAQELVDEVFDMDLKSGSPATGTAGLPLTSSTYVSLAWHDLVAKLNPARGAYQFPRDIWPESVRRLHPSAVYYDRGNVVIRLVNYGFSERGYYIETVWSSTFSPDIGQDAQWTLIPVKDAPFLFEYKRKL